MRTTQLSVEEWISFTFRLKILSKNFTHISVKGTCLIGRISKCDYVYVRIA